MECPRTSSPPIFSRCRYQRGSRSGLGLKVKNEAKLKQRNDEITTNKRVGEKKPIIGEKETSRYSPHTLNKFCYSFDPCAARRGGLTTVGVALPSTVLSHFLSSLNRYRCTTALQWYPFSTRFDTSSFGRICTRQTLTRKRA